MQRTLYRYLAGALLGLGFAVAAAGPVHAENKCKPGEPSETDESGQFHIEERDGKKVYVIDSAITVCGKVPRPLVAYVLQARSINYEWESLKQEFLPKIRETVERAPF